MREGDFVFFMGILSHEERKQQIHILCWLASGALINFFLLRKSGGGAYRGGYMEYGRL